MNNEQETNDDELLLMEKLKFVSIEYIHYCVEHYTTALTDTPEEVKQDFLRFFESFAFEMYTYLERRGKSLVERNVYVQPDVFFPPKEKCKFTLDMLALYAYTKRVVLNVKEKREEMKDAIDKIYREGEIVSDKFHTYFKTLGAMEEYIKLVDEEDYNKRADYSKRLEYNLLPPKNVKLYKLSNIVERIYYKELDKKYQMLLHWIINKDERIIGFEKKEYHIKLFNKAVLILNMLKLKCGDIEVSRSEIFSIIYFCEHVIKNIKYEIKKKESKVKEHHFEIMKKYRLELESVIKDLEKVIK